MSVATIRQRHPVDFSNAVSFFVSRREGLTRRMTENWFEYPMGYTDWIMAMIDGGEGMPFLGHDWTEDRTMTVVPWDWGWL